MSRITDYLRERRIEALANATKEHMAGGRSDEGRIAFQRMGLEINARSAAQVDRMERRVYLPKPVGRIKRAVMTAYCWGLLPAGVVRFAFRHLPLRGA